MNILRSLKRLYYFNDGGCIGLIPTFMQVVFIPLMLIGGIVYGVSKWREGGWILSIIFLLILVFVVFDLTYGMDDLYDELREETNDEYVDWILNEGTKEDFIKSIKEDSNK